MQINLTDLGDDAKQWLLENRLMEGVSSPKDGIELSPRNPAPPSPSHTPSSMITLNANSLKKALAYVSLPNKAFIDILAALMDTHTQEDNHELAELVDAYKHNRKNKKLAQARVHPLTLKQSRYNTLLLLADEVFYGKIANCGFGAYLIETKTAPAPPDAEDPHRSTTAPRASCTIL